MFLPNKIYVNKLPVMFWIHGGDFYQGYGGGILYDGTSIAEHENVVVVAINYRLGALGFLYSGPDNKTQFTGNYGILDQQFALHWLQRNARAFGGTLPVIYSHIISIVHILTNKRYLVLFFLYTLLGDPSQVTIFGQSAGSESVGTLLNMPSATGLFSKAIMQSFPAGLPFRNSNDAPSFTKFVAKDSGCPDVNYEECMRKLPWQEVLAGAVKAEASIIANAQSFLSLFQPFSPTVETPELSKQPMQGFLDGTSIDVPVIIGSVRQEGMIFMYEAFKKGLKRAEEDGLLGLIYGFENVGKVLKQYPRTGDKQGDMRNHTAPIVTDSLFKCPIRHVILQMLKNQSTTSKIYNYHFDHVLSFGDKFWLPTSPICLDTVCHGDELPILFRPNITVINGVYTKKEILLSTEMQTYWGNFAKEGIPGVSNDIEWVEFNAQNESAMKFSTTDEGITNHQYTEMCEFWDSMGYTWILK